MATQAVLGGTLAAAVVGAGTVASNASNVSNASTAVGSSSVKATATQVVHELARTGTDITTVLAVFGVLLLIAGLLLVGLTKRHGVQRSALFGLDFPDTR